MDERNQKSRSITNNVNFEITISFDNSVSEEILEPQQIQYHATAKNKDLVSIKTDEIFIKGSRNETKAFESLKEWKDLWKFYSSSIYDDILKSLVFYQLKEIITPKITQITIILNEDKENPIVESNEKIAYFQNVNKKIVLDNIFINCEKIFEFGKKGNAYLNSAFYWIQSKYEKNKFYEFERLWRSFNGLYNYSTNGTSDAKGLEKVIGIISANKELFSESLSKLKKLPFDNFRWSAMILNYETRKDRKIKNNKTEYENLISLFSKEEVERIIEQLDKEDYDNDKFKKMTEFYKAIENNKATVEEEKWLNLFLRYYIYFVRCSFFHGGKNDAKYNLFTVSRYDNELEFINKYLSCLICECLNAFEKLDPKNNKKGAK